MNCSFLIFFTPLCRASLLRPAPFELPQGGNAARVEGCSGAIEGACPFFFNLSIYLLDNLLMAPGIPLQDNLIIDKTFQFALSILKFTQLLQEQRHFVLSNQQLRSGTSIGANVREAQNAESKIDFIHKFKIAAKEADETEYWLLLCREISNVDLIASLLAEIKIIQKIITKIVATTKKQL